MTLWTALERRFDQTVTRNAFASYNTRGDRSYSTMANTYVARVEGVQDLVKGPDGRDVIARTRVFVGPTSTGGVPAFTVQDKITLPDNTTPNILNVATLRDRSGVNHQVVYLG